MLNRSVIDAQLVELIGGWRCVSGWPPDLIPLQEQPIMSKDNPANARPEPPPPPRVGPLVLHSALQAPLVFMLCLLFRGLATGPHTHTHATPSTQLPKHNRTPGCDLTGATCSKGPPVCYFQ